MKAKKIANYLASTLTAIGGLNWASIGFPKLLGYNGMNIVEKIFGLGTTTNIIYTLVGASVLYLLIMKIKK
jgi:uncharacterized membrane protein YuzA (DUF378 family)